MEETSIVRISKDLFAQLQQVEPATDGIVEYRPCAVKTTDGRLLERVYVVEATAYKNGWGVWPWDDKGKTWVRIEDVASISESPHRLPAKLANRLYEAGESGMGYTIFTVVLNDGRRLPYVTGNAVDFPNWPPGVTAAMVRDVKPHAGREHFRDRPPAEFEASAPYAWCLFKLPAEN